MSLFLIHQLTNLITSVGSSEKSPEVGVLGVVCLRCDHRHHYTTITPSYIYDRDIPSLYTDTRARQLTDHGNKAVHNPSQQLTLQQPEV